MANDFVNPDWECPKIKRYPELPQAKNGVLDLSLLDDEDEDIIVRVQRWSDIAPSDDIVAYFNSTASDRRVIEDDSQVAYDVPIHTSQIPNGNYLVWYALHKAIGNCSRSQVLPVKVIGSKSELIAGPVFPDAGNGVLTYKEVEAKKGTPIRTNYPTIEEGDSIIFHWVGYDADGFSVPAASYVTQEYTATHADHRRGYLEGSIPAENILAVGNRGEGVAYYTVGRGSGNKTSLTTDVVISWADIPQLQITTTTGAPNPSDQLPHIRPYNHVAVFGEPGLPITATVSDGGAIAEADGETTYDTRLDHKGLAHFRVSTDVEQVAANAYSSPLIGYPPHTTMDFYDYRDGSAGIEAYCYTTGAPCDDATPCSIYIVVKPALITQKVHVQVGGNARIDGVLTSTEISPNKDGSATINIYDTHAEKVTATLYVPGQPGSPVQAPLEFIQFPAE